MLCIPSRSMHHSKHIIRTVTNKASMNSLDNFTRRNYAVHTGNKPEMPSNNNKPNPQALKNNPVTNNYQQRHNEKHVQKCNEDPDCAKKVCPKICGTPGKRVATAHYTHGSPRPDLSQGQLVTADPNKDYNGNNKIQNALVYTNPHETAPTQEIPKLTSFVNDPDVKKNTDPYENIP